jgi:hypothetical protein
MTKTQSALQRRHPRLPSLTILPYTNGAGRNFKNTSTVQDLALTNMSTRMIAAAIADSSPAWQSKASPIDSPRVKMVVNSSPARPVTVREGNALKVIVLAMDMNTQRAAFLGP